MCNKLAAVVGKYMSWVIGIRKLLLLRLLLGGGVLPRCRHHVEEFPVFQLGFLHYKYWKKRLLLLGGEERREDDIKCLKCNPHVLCTKASSIPKHQYILPQSFFLFFTSSHILNSQCQVQLSPVITLIHNFSPSCLFSRCVPFTTKSRWNGLLASEWAGKIQLWPSLNYHSKHNQI